VSSQNIDFTLLAQLLLERSQGAVDALDESDWPAMLHATESYDAWREHEYSAHPTQDTWELYGGRATREQATRTLADILTWLCSPSLGKTGREWGAVRVQSDLAEIAVAAKRYQFATGEYPESLDALVPDYVDAIPEDFLTAGAYVYKRSDTGCVIYSKGADGIDTGGVGDRNPDATNAMLLGISIEALSEMSREDYSEKDRDDVAIVLGTFTNEPAGTKGEE